MSRELSIDPRLVRLVGAANAQAMQSIDFAKNLATTRSKLGDYSLGDEKATGACSHCDSTPRDRRLYSKKGCRFCRNSVSDAFAEGW